MKSIDFKLKSRNRTLFIKDIDTFSNNNLGLSNPMFGRYLYQELSKKVMMERMSGCCFHAYWLQSWRVFAIVQWSRHVNTQKKGSSCWQCWQRHTSPRYSEWRKQRFASLQQSCKNTAQYYACNVKKNNNDPTDTQRRSRPCGTYTSEALCWCHL